MVEVFTSRSGVPSIRIAGVAIHSPYDPVREARRFVDTALGTGRPSTVVILGEGLGYLSGCIATLHPGARVLRVCYSRELFDQAAIFSAESWAPDFRTLDVWHPGLNAGLDEFLLDRIGELDVEGLRVLEWPPSAKLFPQQSRAANEAVQRVLRELSGSIVTTMAVGKLWLRNCVSNFLFLDGCLQGAPCSVERAVVIAASGPSLEESAPVLREMRDAIDLWALPSSLLFLQQARLEPDLIVMTDPGFYAVNHLHHAVPTCPVVMPLSAARGLWRLPAGGTNAGAPLPFLIAQPGLLEGELLKALEHPAPWIAPHGTVAATAMDLARAATRGPIIFAGLDLCTNDVISHARPNEFETFFQVQISRTSPFDSLLYQWSADRNAARIPGGRNARAPLSLQTYASWLGASRSGEPARVFRLFPSVVDLPGMTSLDAEALGKLARTLPSSSPGPRLSPNPRFPVRARRVEVVRDILFRWKTMLTVGIEKARGAHGYRVLAEPPLLGLVGQISAQGVLETRRKARLGDEKGAREAAVAVLEESTRFLQALEEKALNAG
ncbi:MAG TPA: 6-hydroxymethylpterin diphosphokinase MptE-like protein [Spirochaetia bacterium]|nr:6-hydroxymethylpterin diphosphokinase MptE-like protein [Spirochaetia bacterium]